MLRVSGLGFIVLPQRTVSGRGMSFGCLEALADEERVVWGPYEGCVFLYYYIGIRRT